MAPFGMALKTGASASANTQFAALVQHAAQIRKELGRLEGLYRSLGLHFYSGIPISREYDLGTGPRQICQEVFVIADVDEIGPEAETTVVSEAETTAPAEGETTALVETGTTMPSEASTSAPAAAEMTALSEAQTATEAQVLRDLRLARTAMDEGKNALKGAANQISAIPAEATRRIELMAVAWRKLEEAEQRLEMVNEDIVSLESQMETLMNWLPPLWTEVQSDEDKEMTAARLRAWMLMLPEVRYAIEHLGCELEEALKLGLGKDDVEERFLGPGEVSEPDRLRAAEDAKYGGGDEWGPAGW